MTDLDRAVQLFESFGYSERREVCGSLKPREYRRTCKDNEVYIEFGDGCGDKYTWYGYRGFGFTLAFTADGKYINHGAFE